MNIIVMNPQMKSKGKSVTFKQKQALVLFMQLGKDKFGPSFMLKHYLIHYYKSNYVTKSIPPLTMINW